MSELRKIKKFRCCFCFLLVVFFSISSLVYGSDYSSVLVSENSLPIAVLINSPLYEERVSAVEIALIEFGTHYNVYMAFEDEFPEPGSYSAIIVTGGLTMASYFDDDGEYLNGSYLIKQADVPVLGICLGNQIIGRLYGSGLKEFEQRGWSIVKKVKDDILLENIPDTFNAWQNHAFVLSRVPEGFELLCDGDFDSIQMIKHKELPIYGVMFHPEKSNGSRENHAKLVLANFVELVKENDHKFAESAEDKEPSDG